jgi:hypothetical protein
VSEAVRLFFASDPCGPDRRTLEHAWTDAALRSTDVANRTFGYASVSGVAVRRRYGIKTDKSLIFDNILYYVGKLVFYKDPHSQTRTD